MTAENKRFFFDFQEAGSNPDFTEKIIVNLGEIKTASATEIAWHYKLPGLKYSAGPSAGT